jgi:mannan endo-1,4-beta-mannosidase
VPSTHRHRLILIVAALATLLALAPASAAAQASTAPQAKQRPASVRTALGAARSVGRPGRCLKRVPPARAKRMTPRQRKRLNRRMRSCRRNLAGKSSVPLTTKYWGAWIGSQLTGEEAPWDMGAAAKFEQLAGKGMSTIHFSSPFANCSSSPCDFYEFPSESMEDIRAHGSIPFFSWGSQATPASPNQPNFQLADVISGSHDAYIRSFAEEARDWGHPFFLRFNWEMNGNWFAWMEGVNGNQAGESVVAWRHVHDIFTEVGATNATWVWCANVDPDGQLGDLASLYPGDQYVDWTGLDGYNWGTHPARDDVWRSFDDLYRSTYDYITQTLAPSKPLAIAEIGSTEYGGSKSAWIEDALSSVANDYPQVRALLWFEKFDDSMDWPIETSSGATAAFAAGIQNSIFGSNTHTDLGASTISAPS